MSPELPVAFEFTTAAAPVQAEGTVAGRPFYFRARHEEWTFAVSDAPGLDPADVDAAVAAAGRGWHRQGAVAERGAASFLPADEARAIIRACAAAYLAHRAGRRP